jgi:hypothetical protein
VVVLLHHLFLGVMDGSAGCVGSGDLSAGDIDVAVGARRYRTQMHLDMCALRQSGK